MAWAVLSGFILACVAPYIHRAVPKYSGWLLALLPAALCAYFIRLAISLGDAAARVSWTWAPMFGLDFSFRGDGLALTFAILISGIGVFVTLYSHGYLHGHALLGRWYAYLLMFMASMLGVVLTDNLVALFIFWELTSLSSYLLIGFNHEEEQSRYAALQAMLVTGLGGLVMMAGLVLLILATGTATISEVLEQGDAVRAHPWYAAILVLLLAGAVTKSAQFPFHFWLPNAMAAPTPASAYLHSSTMVKAGLYLMARMHPALGGTDLWLALVTGFGAVTMLFGAFMATHQRILKRLLAYSTVSALGAIMMALGLGSAYAAKAAIVFLFAHALYKAALFMVAGTIDHEAGEKDVTKLGGLAGAMPYTTAGAVVAGLSISGVPLLFGFVGKELLYEATQKAPGWAAVALTAATMLSGMFFIVVACWVVVKPMFGPRVETPKHPHEAPASMWLGPAVLGVCSLGFGLLPGMLDGLLGNAANAIAGKDTHLHLAIWHGFNLTLVLSAVTLLGGVALYWLRDRYTRLTAPLLAPSPYGPNRWYDDALLAMMNTARWQTRVLQNGYLRTYLLFILVAVLAAVGGTLFFGAASDRLAGLVAEVIYDQLHTAWQTLLFYELGLGMIIVLAIGAAVHSRTRLAAIAALGVVGYGIALIFVLYGAPDLAMTQLIIETLTVILFVLVFYHLPAFAMYSSVAVRARDLVIAIAVGTLMGLLALIAADQQAFAPISEYFQERSYEEAHGRNIVNVILVDFRGVDTLGEITVLATAAMGAFALLKLRLSKRARAEKPEAPAPGEGAEA